MKSTTSKQTPRPTTPTSEPIRTCIGCRRTRPVGELVRLRLVVHDRTVEQPFFEEIAIDSAAGGRGAWLCRSSVGAPTRLSCLAAAVRSRGFDRAFRQRIAPTVIEDLVRRMSALDDGGRPVNRR